MQKPSRGEASVWSMRSGKRRWLHPSELGVWWSSGRTAKLHPAMAKESRFVIGWLAGLQPASLQPLSSLQSSTMLRWLTRAQASLLSGRGGQSNPHWLGGLT